MKHRSEVSPSTKSIIHITACAYRHQGRLLKWLMHLCKGELRTTYTHDPKNVNKPMMYTLQANTNQIALLTQYNSGLSFSEDELSAATQMGADTMKGTGNVVFVYSPAACWEFAFSNGMTNCTFGFYLTNVPVQSVEYVSMW